MKKLLLACCIVLGAAGASFAQGGGRTPQTPEQQTDRLNTAVTLTDAQKTKVLSIYKMQAASMDSLTKAGGDMRTAGMPLRTRYTDMIKAVLTPEQVAKMPQGRGRGNGGGGGGGGGTPPPPSK